MKLVCATGTLPVLRAAVANGADYVAFALRDDASGAADFPARHFTVADAACGIRYAHEQGARVVIELDAYPDCRSAERARHAIDAASDLGADAIQLADPGLMQYAARLHPSLALHLSQRAGASSYEAIDFYRQHFGLERALVSRTVGMVTLERITRNTRVGVEVYGFGSPCVMLGGQCALSSYTTGVSVNTCGVCTPAHAVHWRQLGHALECRLNDILVEQCASGEKPAWPVPCKGRYEVVGRAYRALDEPGTLNAIDLVPALRRIGVAAVRIDGGRGYAGYVAWATHVWREALGAHARSRTQAAAGPALPPELQRLARPGELSLGPYSEPWR